MEGKQEKALEQRVCICGWSGSITDCQPGPRRLKFIGNGFINHTKDGPQCPQCSELTISTEDWLKEDEKEETRWLGSDVCASDFVWV